MLFLTGDSKGVGGNDWLDVSMCRHMAQVGMGDHNFDLKRKKKIDMVNDADRSMVDTCMSVRQRM